MAPAAPGAVPQTGSFAGTYHSNWGTTVFSEAGANVHASYPTGTMSCTPPGAVASSLQGGGRVDFDLESGLDLVDGGEQRRAIRRAQQHVADVLAHVAANIHLVAGLRS